MKAIKVGDRIRLFNALGNGKVIKVSKNYFTIGPVKTKYGTSYGFGRFVVLCDKSIGFSYDLTDPKKYKGRLCNFSDEQIIGKVIKTKKKALV